MEEIGIIRRTLQDVLVPEMQGMKERLAGHDEKFISIEKRLDGIDARLGRIETRMEGIEARMTALESEMRQGFAAVGAALDRIEARLSFSELDKRICRLEILQDKGSSGPKSSAA
jgi:chromosome segregation ATPase